MSAVDCRNENLKSPRGELASGRFAKQSVSQLSSADGKILIQQLIGQIRKSQTLSGGFVLVGKRPDSVWLISTLKSKFHFNPIEFNGIGEYPVVVRANVQEVGHGF